MILIRDYFINFPCYNAVVWSHSLHAVLLCQTTVRFCVPLYLLYLSLGVSALPQSNLDLTEAQLPQAGLLFLPILQRPKLGQTPYSGSLISKGLVQGCWGEAPLLGYTPRRNDSSKVSF